MNGLDSLPSGSKDERIQVSLSPDISCSTLTTSSTCSITGRLSVGAISPFATGNLTLNGYGPNKIVLDSTGVNMTGNTAVTGTLTSSGLITANAGLTVTGNANIPGYTFASGYVGAFGANVTSTGRVTWTASMTSTGLYLITFASAHPLGANYIVHVTSQGGTAAVRGSTYVPTSTTFGVHSLAIGTGRPTALPFSFTVLA